MRKSFYLLVMLFIGITAFSIISCNDGKKEEPKAEVANKDSVEQALKRGEYLTLHVSMCLDCHSTRDFSKYSGPVKPGTEGMGGEVFDKDHGGAPGKIYARNITPDAETGIGTWTDDEILRAITQGISKKGDTLFPIMPYAHFNHMAKSDLLSIIAYIRTLKAIKNKVPSRELLVPISAVYPAPALAPSVDGNVLPPETDPLKYGAYLVNAGLCSECHTPRTPKGPDFSKMYAGGFSFNMGSFNVTSANITSDSATGIGAWNEERFLNKFTNYRDEKSYSIDPGKQNTLMPVSAYAGMKDSDLKAIYAFIHTVPPIKNKVEKYPK
jgi:mono/diheme cytochrome c family protein